MAIHYLQLHFAERVLSSQYPYDTVINKSMAADDYSKLDDVESVIQELLGSLYHTAYAERLQIAEQESEHDIYSEEYADSYRKGIRLLRIDQLRQCGLLMKGFYFQSIQNDEKALLCYSQSLCKTKYSVNIYRLRALENIELIISKKTIKEDK